MADSIQLGAADQSAAPQDNNAGPANSPGAGERSAPLMARPDWVPEKFFKEGVIDYKGMAGSYSELEKKQGSTPNDSKPTDQTQQPDGQGNTGTGKTADGTKPAEVPSIPGVAAERVTHFTSEFSKDGKLSDASYDELAKLGYPKPVVDAYVRGLNADQEVAQAQIASKQIDEIKAAVGGEESFTDMVQWAKANWSEADQKVYNDAVSSRDVAKVKMAVNGLKAAFDAENGEQPRYIGGRRPAGIEGITPYASESDVALDMARPEYKNSEEFRQKVYARLKVSDVFSNSKDYTKVKR